MLHGILMVTVWEVHRSEDTAASSPLLGMSDGTSLPPHLLPQVPMKVSFLFLSPLIPPAPSCRRLPTIVEINAFFCQFLTDLQISSGSADTQFHIQCIYHLHFNINLNFLFSKMDSPNIFNLLFLCSCSISLIILIALFCAFSTSIKSFFRHKDQDCTW